jgi:hypothetical protein
MELLNADESSFQIVTILKQVLFVWFHAKLAQFNDASGAA